MSYGSKGSAWSDPITVTWTAKKPTPTPTPEPTPTPTPEPTPEPDPVPDRPTGLVVATEAGSLDLAVDWDDVDGADDYLVRWREAGPGNELNAGVRVESSEADITVDDYGEWVVRVEACNEAGCGLGARQAVTVEQLPPAQPQNLAVSTTPGELDLSAAWDDVDDADWYRLNWRKSGGSFEDNTAPTLSEATVEGTALRLTYNEELKTPAPEPGAFTVTVDGSAASLADNSPVALSGITLTLTLAQAVSAGQAVTVSYDQTNAGDNPVQDPSGNQAASFTGREVRRGQRSRLPHPAPTSRWTATANGWCRWKPATRPAAAPVRSRVSRSSRV